MDVVGAIIDRIDLTGLVTTYKVFPSKSVETFTAEYRGVTTGASGRGEVGAISVYSGEQLDVRKIESQARNTSIEPNLAHFDVDHENIRIPAYRNLLYHLVLPAGAHLGSLNLSFHSKIDRNSGRVFSFRTGDQVSKNEVSGRFLVDPASQNCVFEAQFPPARHMDKDGLFSFGVCCTLLPGAVPIGLKEFAERMALGDMSTFENLTGDQFCEAIVEDTLNDVRQSPRRHGFVSDQQVNNSTVEGDLIQIIFQGRSSED
ncbi:hypothetical protein OAH18_01300 [bacterium]|nr:hypothetical protein [bacterium]